MANNELQIRQWFSMLLNIDPKSENLPVNQRRKKFERKLPGILASISHGGEWKIFITNWQSPRPGKKKTSPDSHFKREGKSSANRTHRTKKTNTTSCNVVNMNLFSLSKRY